MNYLNPLLIFGNNYSLDSKTLQRERKRLMAELELSGGDALILNGRSFTRNELIGYFEELQQENTAAWHQAIAEDPILLRFLQEATIKAGARFKNADLYDDPAFIAWVTPYFQTAFNNLVTDAFQRRDESGVRALLDNRPLVTPEGQEQCWLFVTGILEKNIALFDNYHGRGQKNAAPIMPINEIFAFLSHGYLEVIKQLPDSRFARLKDRYAFSIQHPAIAAFNRDENYRAATIYWLEDAWNLAVSPDIKARIRVKGNELNNILQRATPKKKSSWWILWVILIILRILFYLIHG